MKNLIMILLTASCLIVGYGYYKMNPHEPWIAAVFTFGILGIMLSVVRNSKRL